MDFSVAGFDNNQTFFTDSNGLEMQKRVLNYRPTWDFVNTNLKESNENVTANYFPINSAIAMIDEAQNKQFLVCNDRPQAGSALTKGGIQFMQNRRIPADDGRGMGENVDETDINKNNSGIAVSASYFVQIFNRSVRKSQQRAIQHRTDDPAQYFFSFNASATGSGKASSLSEELVQYGIKGSVKLVSMPLAKNKILVRLENMADLFDLEAEMALVDLNFIQALVKDANPNLSGQLSFKWRELSLSGNMDIAEMQERRIQWKTRDDAKPGLNKSKLSFDVINGSEVVLVPQRIRVFEFSLDTESDLFLQS